MNRKHLVVGVIWLALVTLTIWFASTNEYMKFHTVEAKVLAHHQSFGRHSSSDALVIQTAEWGTCAAEVGPVTYELSKVGDVVRLHLRKMDCMPTLYEDTFFFWATILLETVSAFVTLMLGINLFTRLMPQRSYE